MDTFHGPFLSGPGPEARILEKGCTFSGAAVYSYKMKYGGRKSSAVSDIQEHPVLGKPVQPVITRIRPVDGDNRGLF